tara:strand:+ start:477 stop:1091 length:615 start_codon:yes stop_codon:yes gene_type:complete
MNIYEKLPLEMKEEVDKQFWLNHKITIETKEISHRKLRLLLQVIPYHLTSQERNVIDWLCWYVIRPRTYGEGECGLNTESGEYEYKCDKKNKKPLHKYISKWIHYLETKNDKPYFETLYEAVRLAVDDWVGKNVFNNDLFQHFALELGFNIPSMYQNFFDTYDWIDYNVEAIFCSYVLDVVEHIIMKSFAFEIETDNELTTDED